MNILKTIVCCGFVLLALAGISQAYEVGETGYGFAMPLAVHYGAARHLYGSAGILIGQAVAQDTEVLGVSESVNGLLIDGTIGQNDYSYSIGFGGSGPIGILGAAIRATALVGKTTDAGYFLHRNQKAYGLELSAAMGVGVRFGVFRTEGSHTVKVLSSIGIGF